MTASRLDRTKRTNSRFRSIATNTLLIVASLLVCALLLEAGLRVYAELLFPKMMVLDDKLGWRHAANVSKTFQNESGENILVAADAYGHRGGAHKLEKVPGKFRVLVLGDSFTEGVQVGEKDVFTSRMETADPGLEVINAGVGGYGTVQEYLYLASEGLQFRPDLVLLMFFENDLTDNVLTYYPGFGPRPYATLNDGAVRVVETLDPSAYERFILPLPFRMALNEHSYFYYFANSRLYQPLFARQMRELQQADLRKIDTDTRYGVLSGMLAKLKDFTHEHKIPFVVGLIPTREDVASGHSEVARIVSEHCQQQAIACIPLIDRFGQEKSASPPLYFREDMHWTKDGHTLAADEILRHLRRSQESIQSGVHE